MTNTRWEHPALFLLDGRFGCRRKIRLRRSLKGTTADLSRRKSQRRRHRLLSSQIALVSFCPPGLFDVLDFSSGIRL
jgi:hypothetical protein